MNSNSKATSRRSKNSRIQAGQTSLVAASVNGSNADDQQITLRIDSIVERLCASQVERDELLKLLGYCEGSRWAASKATIPEVGRLRLAGGRFGDDWHAGVETSAYSYAERFLFVIRPDFDGGPTVTSEFWQAVSGDPEMPETVYVLAFALGARKIWDEFEDQIYPAPDAS